MDIRGMLGTISPDLSRVGGVFGNRGLVHVNGPNCAITRVQRRQEKSLKVWPLSSAHLSELEM
jgi:hypothetical protein